MSIANLNADGSVTADSSLSVDTLFINSALQAVIPSYLYQQFRDDEDLQAFVEVYNDISQGYLNWFNSTPLAIYTNSNISGPLLDWTLQGIYGISRPSISEGTNVTQGPTGTYMIGALAVGEFTSSTVTTIIASDDIYKRFATWVLYQGDGVQMTVQWLLKRINRFLYGTYGSDASLDTLSNIGLSISSGAATITVPSVSGANSFAALVSNNLLPLPLQMTFSVTVG